MYFLVALAMNNNIIGIIGTLSNFKHVWPGLWVLQCNLPSQQSPSFLSELIWNLEANMRETNNFTQSSIVFRPLTYCWERKQWYLLCLFARSYCKKKKKKLTIGVHKPFKSCSSLDFLCQIRIFSFKILLLIPSFYLRHVKNKELDPVRPCQSVKNEMWIRLKIDSPRGTESEKQQSPKADRYSPCGVFLSCCAECLDILPELYYSQRIWARRADSGPGIIKLTLYAGPEFCQNSACRLTFREFAKKKQQKNHVCMHDAGCISRVDHTEC